MFKILKKLFKPPTDLAKLVKEGAVIVDVRTKDEFQVGHIEGSKNIPLDTVKKELEKIKKLNRPIVTVCRSGNRSAIAKSIFSSAGIQAYNGGAWTALKRKLI
jgi:rhodanese-related sulfurtransferase